MGSFGRYHPHQDIPADRNGVRLFGWIVGRTRETFWRKIASEASKDEGAPKKELSKIGYKSTQAFSKEFDVFMDFRNGIGKAEEVGGSLALPEKTISGVPFRLKDDQAHRSGFDLL